MELVLLAPALILLVLFVLWAGRGGRAGLVADLAAGEAAVVASLCCEEGEDPDAVAAREKVVEQVLAGRPGLDFLCVHGIQGAQLGSGDGFVDEEWLETFKPEIEGAVRGVGAIGVRFECETDGAVAPLRGLFPNVSFFGQATEVIAIPPHPTLTVTETEHDEGTDTDETLRFLFELSAPTSQTVDVYYKTNTLTATPPDLTHAKSNDYTEVTTEQSTTIPARDLSITVDIDITRDNMYELDETFELEWRIVPSEPCAADAPRLSNPKPDNAVIECTQGHTDYGKPVHPNTRAVMLPELVDQWKPAQPAVGTILNDDGKPTLTVSSPSADEGTDIDFTVGFNKATALDVSFDYQTKDDTSPGARQATDDSSGCTPGSSGSCDYQFTQGSVTIAADETGAPSETVPVSTGDDSDGEGDETFMLEATVTNGNALPPTVEGVGTIVDNEPKISIGDSTSSTTDEKNNPTLDFTVTLNTSATSPVTVDWTTTSAVPGNPALSGTSCSNALVPDYEAGSGTLTFAAGTTSQTITVNICDDLREESDDERFGVQLSNPSPNASIDDGLGVGRINDDEDPPEISVEASPASVEEGKPMDFKVTLNRVSELAVAVEYAVKDGTAKLANGDYSIDSPHSTAGTLSFPAGYAERIITVQTLNDTFIEVDETLEVALTNPQRATLHSTKDTATGTITDYITNRISIADARALEGEDLVFTVTVNPVLNQAITLDYVTADSTATEGDDYTGVTTTTTMTIPANTATKDITVTSLIDAVNEVADETFFVNLSNAAPATLVAFDDNKAVGTIQNVISRDLCLLDAATVAEGQALVFEVVLGEHSAGTCSEKASTETVTVDWKTRDPTTGDPATAGDDYVAVTSATLTFAPGETKKTLSVQTNNDQLYTEPTEKLFVDLIAGSAQNAVISDATGEGEITNAPRASLSVADASADEGNDLTLTVSATNLPATGNVTVDYTVSGLTATGPGTATGDDFDMKSPTTATGTLTLSSTQTTATVTLTTTKGDAYEPDETVRIDLSNPSANAVLSDAAGIGTINQECVDQSITTQSPPAFQFESGQLTGLPHALGTAPEGQKMYFAFTINAPFCSGTQYFKLSATDVTTDSSDFTKPSTTQGYELGGSSGISHVVGSPGTACPGVVNQALQTIICLDTTDDDVDEADETFTMVVNWLDSGANAMPSHYHGLTGVTDTGAITDNDPLPNVRIADAAASESNAVVFTVTMDRASSRAVTLDYTTKETGTGVGHAIEGTDYTRKRSTNTTRLVFSAGETSKTLTVDTLTDSNNESPETFEMELSWPTGQTQPAVLADATAEGTIVDTQLPVMSIADATVVEGAGDAVFVVTLDQASSSPVTVNYSTVQLSSGDFATGGVLSSCSSCDYESATNQTLTFPSNTTSATISVSINDDSTAENTEKFRVRLQSPNGAFLADSLAVGTIIDNDTACIDPTDNTETPPTLSMANQSTTEAADSLAFTATLSEPFCSDASLEVTTSDGTATGGGVDYVSWSATVTVPAFYTQLTWGIEVVDDSLVEDNETFRLNIEWADTMLTKYTALPAVTAVGTITDDDGDLKVSVNDPAKVNEGSTVDFVVSLDKVGGRDVTVQYATSGGTATAGSDYTAAAGTATIPAGDISVVVPVQTLADDVSLESDETFNLVLSSPTGATLDDFIGVGTIADVPQPRISVNDVTAAEGSPLSFTVTLDKAGTAVVSVDYATKDLTATAGLDYSAVSGTLVFSPGDLSKTVTVATSRDAISDGGANNEGEKMQLVLSDPVNASFADFIGVGTITDVPPPKVRVSDITATEGDKLLFEVALDAAATWDVVVPFTTKDGTAIQPGDYTASADTVTIAAGDTTAQVPVITIDDRLDEDAETMRLELSATNDAVLADRIAVGTLFDNDALPTVSLTSAKVTGDEKVTGGNAGSLSFTVQLSEPSGRDVTVDYATDDITATGGASGCTACDYTDNDGTLTFAAGTTSRQVVVNLVDDNLAETAEAFRFTLSNPTNATLGTPATAQGVILDDDTTEPSVLLRNHTPATEGSPATVEVYLDRASADKVVTVYYATSDGTATAGTDYTTNSGTLSYALREQTKTISVTTTDDLDIEGDETFTVTLSNATNANIVDQSTTLTILDNDGEPNVSIGDASTTEGGTATFTVSLSFPAKQEVTVDYEARVDGAAGDSSAVPGLDFTATSGTLTFSAGDSTKTITVSTIEDVFDEYDETFWVQLTSATGATVVDSTGQGLILDDDPLPSLSVGDASASEGDPAVFTVTLNTASGRDITATYATAAHSTGSDPATAGTDYSAAPGTLRIPAGSTSTTISVATIEDTDAEHDETFLVKIDNPANAQVADPTGQGTITDDDGLPRLSVADLSLFEDQGPAQFTVTLSHPSPDDDVTVGYRTVACSGDGCATSGTDCTATVPPDYEFTSGTLTITAGDNRGTISVPVCDDLAEEDDETFTLQLVSPTNATILDQEATATIQDDDGPPRISVADVTVYEDRGPAQFTVTLSHEADEDVTVNYATFDRTATQPLDYTATAGTLTIPAGDTTATISVTINDDNLAEGTPTWGPFDCYRDSDPDDCEYFQSVAPWMWSNVGGETFLLRLDSPTGATLDDAEATGEITEDERAPTMLGTNWDASANEPGDDGDTGEIVFWPTLSHPSVYTVTADYSIDVKFNAPQEVNGINKEVVDTTGGQVVFPPGTTSVPIAVPIYGNNLTARAWGTYEYLNASFVISLSNAVNMNTNTGYAEATGRVWDDEFNAYVTTVAGKDVLESADNAVFEVSLNRLVDSDTFIYYNTSDGTATGGIDEDCTDCDYISTADILWFTKGTAIATVSVPIVDDDTDEENESILLNASSRQGTVWIIDDDETPVLSIGDAQTTEASQKLPFLVTLDRASVKNITVDYATADGTATQPGDYTQTTGTLTIAAGDTSGTIEVPIVADEEDEDQESLTLNLSNATNATIGDAQANGIILDGDSLPIVTILDVSETEAFNNKHLRHMYMEFSMDKVSAVPISFEFRVVAVPSLGAYAATPGIDFDPVSSRGRELPEGGGWYRNESNGIGGIYPYAEGFGRFEIFSDLIPEHDERFRVEVRNPVNVVLANTQAWATIVDNDLPIVTVSDVTVAESASSAAITLTLHDEGVEAASVKYRTKVLNTGHSASPGDDYTHTEGTLNIPAGDTTATITVPLLGDTTDEYDEKFVLEFYDPDELIFSDTRAVVTITDDDDGWHISDDTEAEGDDLVFVVTRDDTTSFTTINYTVQEAASSSATGGTHCPDADAVDPDGVDYITPTVSPAFAVGVSSARITVNTCNEKVSEGDEIFLIKLTGTTPASTGTFQGRKLIGTATISASD